ncbi:hypothetical protein OG308_23510 [Nocardia salmonicida]|uniref:Uncharacterized protein n=1 Tax=Nocardia salmonicida TaxID=53431 RepID=A0ABZ1N370_9NOCA
MSPVRVGEQHRDQYLFGCEILDRARHAVQNLGQGRLAGDLFDQGALLGHQPVRVFELGGLHTDQPDPGHRPLVVAQWFVAEIEGGPDLVGAGAQQDRNGMTGVGFTGAIDLIQDGKNTVLDQFGHQLGERNPGVCGVFSDRGEERGVCRVDQVLRARERDEYRGGLPEQFPQVLLARRIQHAGIGFGSASGGGCHYVPLVCGRVD